MKTHCIHGHEYTIENTYIYPEGKRDCKICRHRNQTGWDKLHPEAVVASRKKYNDTHIEETRHRHLKRRHGLSVEQYNQRLTDQGGRCAVCKLPPESGERLVVDHNHNCCSGEHSCTKCLRGLVHQTCNAMLGMSKDRPDVLMLGAEYLRSFGVN